MRTTVAHGPTARPRQSMPGLTSQAARVLVIDPSLREHDNVVRDLRARDVVAEISHNLFGALVTATETRPHAVVVTADAGASVSDTLLGLFVATVSTQLEIPVLLALRAGDVDKLGHAILAGGQPVVDLPYHPDRLSRTLLALASLGRRTDPVRLGPLELDSAAYDARLWGHGIDVSALEFGILFELASNHDHVVPRERLTRRYWPGAADPDATLAAVVARLRRKLESRGAPGLIHTVRGVGFRFDSAPLLTPG